MPCQKKLKTSAFCNCFLQHLSHTSKNSILIINILIDSWGSLKLHLFLSLKIYNICTEVELQNLRLQHRILSLNTCTMYLQDLLLKKTSGELTYDK